MKSLTNLRVSSLGIIVLKVFVSICLMAIFVLRISFFHKDYEQAKFKLLNQLIPFSFEYLIHLQENSRIYFNERTLKPYIQYYDRVVSYMPSSAEAQAMAGFCQYYMGNKTQSAEHYLKAMSLDPEYFWYAYNLGVIFFEDKKYEEAASWFYKAISLKEDQVYKVLSTSRIYQQIVNTIPTINYDFADSYKKSHQSAYQLFFLIKQILEHQQEVPAIDRLNIKIF